MGSFFFFCLRHDERTGWGISAGINGTILHLKAAYVRSALRFYSLDNIVESSAETAFSITEFSVSAF